MQKCSGSQRQTHLQACHRLEAASLTASSVIECSEAWADSHSVASFRCGETPGHCCSRGGASRFQRPLCCACVVESEAVAAKEMDSPRRRKTKGERKKDEGKGQDLHVQKFWKTGRRLPARGCTNSSALFEKARATVFIPPYSSILAAVIFPLFFFVPVPVPGRGRAGMLVT